MKLFHIVLITTLLFAGCGRLVRVPEQEQMLRQVYAVQLSKDEIFDRALEWCARTFSHIDDSIMVKDREKGKIIGKGTGKYSEYFDFLVDRQFSYTITIEVKNGRYRVTFDNFIVYYNERDLRSSKAVYKFELGKIKKQLNKHLEDIHAYIARGSAEKEGATDESW